MAAAGIFAQSQQHQLLQQGTSSPIDASQIDPLSSLHPSNVACGGNSEPFAAHSVGGLFAVNALSSTSQAVGGMNSTWPSPWPSGPEPRIPAAVTSGSLDDPTVPSAALQGQRSGDADLMFLRQSAQREAFWLQSQSNLMVQQPSGSVPAAWPGFWPPGEPLGIWPLQGSQQQQFSASSFGGPAPTPAHPSLSAAAADSWPAPAALPLAASQSLAARNPTLSFFVAAQTHGGEMSAPTVTIGRAPATASVGVHSQHATNESGTRSSWKN